MTVQFAPGDVNRSPNSKHQAKWRTHHIIAYGSGNNLVIYTISNGQDRNQDRKDRNLRNLQTVYLDQNPSAVAINGTNGLIAIACGSQVAIFKPVNEYMSVPRWSEIMRFEPGSGNHSAPVNCLCWAPGENELAVGDSHVSLHYISVEYGAEGQSLRWEKAQPAPVEGIDITNDGTRLVSYNYTNLDSFAKVWTRISYGDRSLFDLVYADHDPQSYLVHFQWRTKPLAAEKESELASMAHIRNMRSFMPTLAPDDNDVLYTVTNDQKLNVWATSDFNGHSYLKCWANFDMAKCVDSPLAAFVLVDHASLFQLNESENGQVDSLNTADPNQVKSNGIDSNQVSANSKVSSALGKDVDWLVVIGASDTSLVCIHNISSNPPNSISFEKIASFPTNPVCLPSYCNSRPADSDSGSVEDWLISKNPVYCSGVVADNGALSFMLHDRLKNTLRNVGLSINSSKAEETSSFGLTLNEKFQGHSKSVKKLITSSSSHEGNIMLSISNFPQNNYIWEPLALDSESLTITKRFSLNVTRENAGIHEQGIATAIIINDVFPKSGTLRHHLAVVVEKGGYLSLWDCDGATMDDKDVGLVERREISESSAPRAFFSHQISKSSFAIIAVYKPTLVKAWQVDVAAKYTDKSSFSCTEITAENLPGTYTDKFQISTVDTFLEKDISIIDNEGVLRSVSASYNPSQESIFWEQSLEIETGLVNAKLLHGASLIGKIAIVSEDGLTLTIWDSKFGILEYQETFPEEYGAVRDLDWTFIGTTHSTANSLLAVGFPRFVLLYTSLRYDYTNRIPTFAVLKKIDISDYSSHTIGDSIWIDDTYLVISCGNQFFIDDQWVKLGQDSGAKTSSMIDSTVRQLMEGLKIKDCQYPISDLVRILNGPLPLYHPQFLIQALLMDEWELVETILLKLLKYLREDRPISWNLDLDLMDSIMARDKPKRRNSLFSTRPDLDVFDTFDSSVAELLSEKIASVSLPLMTRHQQTTLRNLVIIVNKLRPLSTSLDVNGMKFLQGFELFRSSQKQRRLNKRDIGWALHSDQKEMLFSTIEHAYHRLTWDVVKETGLVYWVDEHRLRTLMETVARNEFADERDPSGRVSIFYLAIHKKQVLLGLWRTVVHPEKDKVVKFLSNNFAEPRWRSAALKNAFVLLGKHRYMDAAYFFLLAEKVKDCCITLCNKVNDTELALAVARVNPDHDCTSSIIEQYFLPDALREGDRWTTSWAFWQMRRKEVAIQALVNSPLDVIRSNSDCFSETFQKNLDKLNIDTKSNSFLKDDPVLGILYQRLRVSKSMYLEGSKAVSPEREFDFAIRLATIYSRMGCDYLSLLQLKKWQFLDYQPEKEPEAAFSSFTPAQTAAPAPTTFEEPDMSAFSFGF